MKTAGHQQTEAGVSPVLGVILMVAVTVILSATVGVFVFNLGQTSTGQNSNTAGVSVTPNGNGTVTVQLTAISQVERIIVRNVDETEKTISEVGGTVTLPTKGQPVTILSETTKGTTTVVQEYEPSEQTRAATVIDRFTDGGTDEYTTFGNGTVSINESGPTHDGNSLKLVDDNDNPSFGVESTAGLSRYPKAGDIWEVWVYLPDEPKYTYHINYARQNSTSTYDVTLQARDDVNEFRLRKRNSSGHTTFAAPTFNYSTVKGSWVRVQVKWETSGDMTATLYNESGTQLVQATGTDTQFTSGGVSWGVNNVGVSSVPEITFVYDDATIIGSAG